MTDPPKHPEQRDAEAMLEFADRLGDALKDFSAGLDQAAKRLNEIWSPAPQNRAQRRAKNKPRRSRRETQLQAIMRLKGKGRTRRPASRR